MVQSFNLLPEVQTLILANINSRPLSDDFASMCRQAKLAVNQDLTTTGMNSLERLLAALYSAKDTLTQDAVQNIVNFIISRESLRRMTPFHEYMLVLIAAKNSMLGDLSLFAEEHFERYIQGVPEILRGLSVVPPLITSSSFQIGTNNEKESKYGTKRKRQSVESDVEGRPRTRRTMTSSTLPEPGPPPIAPLPPVPRIHPAVRRSTKGSSHPATQDVGLAQRKPLEPRRQFCPVFRYCSEGEHSACNPFVVSNASFTNKSPSGMDLFLPPPSRPVSSGSVCSSPSFLSSPLQQIKNRSTLLCFSASPVEGLPPLATADSLSQVHETAEAPDENSFISSSQLSSDDELLLTDTTTFLHVPTQKYSTKERPSLISPSASHYSTISPSPPSPDDESSVSANRSASLSPALAVAGSGLGDAICKVSEACTMHETTLNEILKDVGSGCKDPEACGRYQATLKRIFARVHSVFNEDSSCACTSPTCIRRAEALQRILNVEFELKISQCSSESCAPEISMKTVMTLSREGLGMDGQVGER